MNVTKQMHDKRQEMIRRYQRMIKQRVVQSGYIKNVGYVNQVSLSVNNIKAKYPVRHIKCDQNKDWRHICGCLEQIVYSTEEVKCNQISLMNLEDLVAAEDHYNIIESMHRSTSEITLFAGEPFIRLWRQNQKLDILNYNKYQQLYMDIKQNSAALKEQHDFNYKTRLDPKYKNKIHVTFNAHCIFDFIKLNIPMRFKQCKHIECFDYTSILLKLEKINNVQMNKQKEVIKCGMNKYDDQCQSWCYPNYNSLLENIVLDEELQQILRKKHSSCYKIFYNSRTNQLMFSCRDEYEEYFDDLVENSICDKIIYKFTNPQMIKLNLLWRKIQQQFINIINTRQRDENFQNYRYQNIQLKFKCPLAQQLNQEGDAAMIDYPGRCINCKQIQFADLPNLIQHYYVILESENKIYKCPLCQYTYESDLKPDQIFRFDEQLKKLMMKFNSNRYEMIKELYYYGEQKLLKYMKKNQRKYLQYRQIHHEIEYFGSLKCILSCSRLNNPLKIIDCLNQSRVSFSSFYEKYMNSNYKLDKQYPLHLCTCQNCLGGITDFCQLQFDDVLHQILQQIQVQFYQLENHVIMYDSKSKSITQIPDNDNLYRKSKYIEKKSQNLIKNEQSELPVEIIKDQK